MVRFFDEDRFEIFATRNIQENEEVLHMVILLKWRECFSDLNKIVLLLTKNKQSYSATAVCNRSTILLFY
jgi:hypothetical protein